MKKHNLCQNCWADGLYEGKKKMSGTFRCEPKLVSLQPLLLRIKRSQMSWLGHVVEMPPGPLPGELSRACPKSSLCSI